MLISLGLDLEYVSRFEAVLRFAPESFASLAYAPDEQAWAAGCPVKMALLFTAKEAVGKALGTGLAVSNGVVQGCREIILSPDADSDFPAVTLCGDSLAAAEAAGIRGIAVCSLQNGGVAVSLAAGLASAASAAACLPIMRRAAQQALDRAARHAPYRTSTQMITPARS